MIDTHCHLAGNEFINDLDQVINDAINSNVKKMIVCAEFRSQFEQILKMSKDYPNIIRPAIGIHPVQEGNLTVNYEHYSDTEDFIRKNSEEIVCIGEVGLDFTPRYIKDPENDKRIQRDILSKQVKLANELDIPVNVHSRSAGSPAIQLLIENNAKKVQLHAFSGNVKSAKPGINAGYYFSIPPSFTINPDKKPLIEAIPLSQILLETDSPVLGRDKTKRNVPSNIIYSAEYIAEIKNISVDEVIKITTENAYKLYTKL